MYYIVTSSKIIHCNNDSELVTELLNIKHMIPCDPFTPNTRSKAYVPNGFYVIKGEILTPIYTTEVNINVNPT